MLVHQIGPEIRRRRLARGWSLGELARRAGTSAPTLHRYESGWRRFELSTLEKLATALGLRLELMFRRRAAPGKAPRAADVVRRIERLFWDRKPAAEDLERFPEWIARRVLTYGQLEDVRALDRCWGRDRFLDIVSRVRWDSAGTSAFWEEMLRMEGRECTKRSSPPEAGNYWTS